MDDRRGSGFNEKEEHAPHEFDDGGEYPQMDYLGITLEYFRASQEAVQAERQIKEKA